MLDVIGPGIEEVRAAIESVPNAPRATPDGRVAPDVRSAELVARVDRVAAKVERMEGAVSAQLPMGMAIASVK